MRRRKRILCAVVGTMLVGAPSSTAHGSVRASEPIEAATAEDGPLETPDETAANEHRRRGEAKFRAGEFSAAIEAFEAARALSPDPTDLYNLGRIHEEMGELEAALAHYREFVKLPRLQLEERRAAAERIEVLRLAVEQDAAKPLPPTQPLVMPRSPAGDTDDALKSKPLWIAGAVLTGIGTALGLGGGLGFGLAARRNSDRVNELSNGSNPDRLSLMQAEDAHARGRDFEVLQIAFIATGGVVAVVGVALLATGLARRKNGRADRRALGPVVGPAHVGLRGVWRF